MLRFLADYGFCRVAYDSGSRFNVFCNNRAHADGCAIANFQRTFSGSLANERTSAYQHMVANFNMAAAKGPWRQPNIVTDNIVVPDSGHAYRLKETANHAIGGHHGVITNQHTLADDAASVHVSGFVGNAEGFCVACDQLAGQSFPCVACSQGQGE